MWMKLGGICAMFLFSWIQEQPRSTVLLSCSMVDDHMMLLLLRRAIAAMKGLSRTLTFRLFSK